jgi:2-haloacid dehalogenase
VATSAPRIVLLDVNGTLTDPAAIGAPWGRPELGTLALDGAVQTAMVEALLGGGDRPFSEHIRSAIAVVVAEAGLDPAGIDAAAEAAAGLPARPDAGEALLLLTGSGLRAVALTNSGAAGGTATLRTCGLAPYVERVIGVDAVRTFKPHPSVYAHALRELEAVPADALLLATHPWDLAGAAHAGIQTAWVTHGTRGWPDVFALPDVRGETLVDVARGIIAVAGV